MAETYKQLHQSQLPSSVGTLATVGSGKMWIVKHIAVVNNHASAQTFALYRGGTAEANIITPPAVVIPGGGCAEFDGTMALNDGETIRGVASVATELTITICGDEVDV